MNLTRNEDELTLIPDYAAGNCRALQTPADHYPTSAVHTQLAHLMSPISFHLSPQWMCSVIKLTGAPLAPKTAPLACSERCSSRSGSGQNR